MITGSFGSWKIVGINDIPATSINANQKSTYVVPENAQIEVRSGDVIGIAQYDNNPLIAADTSNTATTVYVGYDPAAGQIFTEQDIDALRLGEMVETVTTESLGGSGPLEVSLSAEVKPGMHFNRDCILL